MPGRASCVAIFLALTALHAQDLVLRFDVNLVQVDALVTDSGGNHIPNLKAEDFEVLQDGKPQKITHFTYIAGTPAARPDTRRSIVFLLDDAYMEFADFHYAQEAIRRYIDEELQPDDVVAIARTSYGSGALQVFTSDARWLHTALSRMFWRPPVASLQILGVTPPVLTALVRNLDALASYPGRKSIVLVSPGLPIGDFWNHVRQIADSANRASVTIETIDVRGLPVLQPTVADSRMHSAHASSRPSVPDILRASSVYFHSQDALSFLAHMTAGQFQHENNDLFQQVCNAVADSEGYYLIGWYPGAQAFEVKPKRMLDYHRVKISLRRAHGLSVRTRDGFFALPGTNARTSYTPAQQMNQALFSPFRSGDLDVRLTAATGYNPQDGDYIDSLLHILPTGIDFRDVPGRPECRQANLEVLTSPEPLDSREPSGHMDSSVASIQVCRQLEGILHDGLVVAVRNRIPVPGPYRMLAAVRNMKEGDVPSVAQPKSLIYRTGMAPEHTPIGSANQIIEVDHILSGITLESGSFPEPSAGQATYRIAKPNDPAVRQFHPGDTLTYSFGLLRFKEPTYQFQILRDGSPIATSTHLSTDAVTATYVLPSDIQAGPYILEIKSGQASQWIDFEVAR